MRDLAKKHRPRMLLAGASAYPRTIDFKTFADIAHEVGAYLFVDMAHIAGLVAVGLHPSPVPYADVVTTTTHKTLRGPRGGMILCKEALAKKIDSAIFPGSQGGPLEHIIAAKAVALGEAMKPEFKAYQEQDVYKRQPPNPPCCRAAGAHFPPAGAGRTRRSAGSATPESCPWLRARSA